MEATSTDYGQLSVLVKSVGCIVSAAFAISLSWRGRTKWEPSEEDVDRGPQKVAGLLTAVIVTLLWVLWGGDDHRDSLVFLCTICCATCLLALLFYSFVISTQTYLARADDGSEKKIIAGFWLLAPAKEAMKSTGQTVQAYLRSVAHDADQVWSRISRAWAKLVFVVLYLMLVISGSIALACVGILLLTNAPREPAALLLTELKLEVGRSSPLTGTLREQVKFLVERAQEVSKIPIVVEYSDRTRPVAGKTITLEWPGHRAPFPQLAHYIEAGFNQIHYDDKISMFIGVRGIWVGIKDEQCPYQDYIYAK
ncbi:MAG TPA: hypothetical protein VG734_07980 [Lacunisphaera sp.]|nr:hypothetical protein [Lacunisphaera sp.]